MRSTPSMMALVLLTGCVMPPPPTPQPAPGMPAPVSVAEFSRNNDFVELPARHMKTLAIRANHGLLHVEGSDRSTLTVRSLIFSRGQSPAEAERINREIQVHLTSVETENPTLTVTDPHLTEGNQHYQVDLTVLVPHGVRVSIVDGGGSIVVSGLSQGVEIDNESGPIEISDVLGGVQLTNRGGPTTITRASGRIALNDGPSDLTVEQIEGEVHILDAGGKLAVRHVSGAVIARGNRQGLELVNIDGPATLIGIPAERCSLQGVRNLSFKDRE